MNFFHYSYWIALFCNGSNFGGLRDTAKKIGLGEHLEIKLARLDKSDAARGTQCFAINTDLQAELEMPSIRSGTDMLQGK